MKKISLNKAINLIFGKVENIVKHKLYCNDGKEYHIYFTVTDRQKMYDLHYNSTGYFSGKKLCIGLYSRTMIQLGVLIVGTFATS